MAAAAAGLRPATRAGGEASPSPPQLQQQQQPAGAAKRVAFASAAAHPSALAYAPAPSYASPIRGGFQVPPAVFAAAPHPMGPGPSVQARAAADPLPQRRGPGSPASGGGDDGALLSVSLHFPSGKEFAELPLLRDMHSHRRMDGMNKFSENLSSAHVASMKLRGVGDVGGRHPLAATRPRSPPPVLSSARSRSTYAT